MTPEREAALNAELDAMLAEACEGIPPLTPEREAEVKAICYAAIGRTPPLPKPKVVTSDRGGQRGVVIRDADVAVSPADPNARAASDGLVSVRRADWVGINMPEYERQRMIAEMAAGASRRPSREDDPMGIWRRGDD
jgi:hypothetical protein